MHTIQLEYIKPFIDHHKPLNCLDAGCGTGRHLSAALEFGIQDIHGIDLDARSLEEAKTRLKQMPQNTPHTLSLKQASLEQIPYKDKLFDLVICSEVLEHVENVDACLAELKRVLKPQGLLCISVPRFWPEKICWFLSESYYNVKGGHLRIFKKNILLNNLNKQNFNIVKQHYAHAFHSPYWWLKCALKNQNNVLIKAFEKLLLKDMFKFPSKPNPLETFFNPVFGKSLVFYCINNV